MEVSINNCKHSFCAQVKGCHMMYFIMLAPHLRDNDQTKKILLRRESNGSYNVAYIDPITDDNLCYLQDARKCLEEDYGINLTEEDFFNRFMKAEKVNCFTVGLDLYFFGTMSESDITKLNKRIAVKWFEMLSVPERSGAVLHEINKTRFSIVKPIIKNLIDNRKVLGI